ncbi:MAG: histidinol-phosphatase [Helicobacteraceae bacterium]|jgi:histidinol-phosphatase (PHP family)|nr:histidinol-phosphatase [Helicobacteraceae bacterium]
MNIDLHNHTPRCKHAEGGMEAFVQEAIRQKIDIFGFSDHAPLKWDESHRMSADEMDAYESEFFALKEKYADRVALLLGYEADYLPLKTIDEVFDRKVDYLIGSVHFLEGWGFDNPDSVFYVFGLDEFAKRGLDEVWKTYFAAIADMAASGRYDIVGHFDLIKIFGHYKGKEPDEAVVNALEAIKKAGMVVEINASGWRKPVKEQYPSAEILRLAYALNIPITFSGDAHAVSHIGSGGIKAYDLARSVGYKEAAIFENRKMRLVKI